MEYERIHKATAGIISPSKLRMKLMGSNHQNKNGGSNCGSARASPTRLEDSEFVNNSLLAAEVADFAGEASRIEVKFRGSNLDVKRDDQDRLRPGEGENGDIGHNGIQLVAKIDDSNSTLVYPMVKTGEKESLDYDCTSNFEFHKGDRSVHQTLTRSLSRPMSSKWNDAEKWIMSRQSAQSNALKKANNAQNQVNRLSAVNMVRVAPESTSCENKPSVKRVDVGKLAFAFQGGAQSGGNTMDSCPESKDLKEVYDVGLASAKDLTEEVTGVPSKRPVSMRDMGTEMTPIPSQEPSRSATPISATTPYRSPTSSIPSTPRRGEPAPTPSSIDCGMQHLPEHEKNDVSEQEMKLNARREIVALGVQLGKMNIAAWARDGDKENSLSANETKDGDEFEQIDYGNRAAAWEEAEQAKHGARFKREEIRIQAWESQQKAKLDAEMRKIEAQIEQMKAEAQAKLVKKIALARQKSEEKRACADARKNQQAERTTSQAEQIRQTGRIPASHSVCCCWF